MGATKWTRLLLAARGPVSLDLHLIEVLGEPVFSVSILGGSWDLVSMVISALIGAIIVILST